MVGLSLENAVEFLPNKVSYVALNGTLKDTKDEHFFSIDKILYYNNFYLDFGPHNLGQLIQFCNILNEKLISMKNKHIYFYSNTNEQKRTNAVCLLTSWGILFKGLKPEEAFSKFEKYEKETPFLTFHDATQTICTYKLTILDCLKGLEKAINTKHFSIQEFNVEEYNHFEKVENGDLTWISKKFIAFAGPHHKRSSSGGYYNLTPEDYIPYFKKCNVTLVIRLNEKRYDESLFENAGIKHVELYYPDGTNPPAGILQAFIDACQSTSGAVAVHCKAGLGRTGTCIGCYMMMEDKFTAKEIIGWLRLCRPGSVIGSQQQFMEENQMKMWQLGAESIHKDSCLRKLQTLQISPVMPISALEMKQMLFQKSQGDCLKEKKRYQQNLCAASC